MTSDKYLIKISLFFFASLAFVNKNFAQEYEIKGIVKDSEETPLQAATVYMQSAKDSAVVDYTITEKDGIFKLEGKTNEDEVNFFISYTGFQDYYKALSLKEEPSVDFEEIILKESSSTLEEVIVQGTAPPISLKKDTLEFDAGSFNTKDNANLEDLLKKLPGVTVDNDGKIEVNGKEVTEIKINGKQFFGDDPKIATKNLPKDILEKIQVVDKKSKAQEFTKEETDSEDKAINITINEENNKGFFSRLTAEGGTDNRYSLNGIGNYFNNDLQLAVLGSSNNINSPGFSFDDVYDAMGSDAYAIMGGGSGSGITKSQFGGMNFVDSWSDKFDISSNYTYKRESTDSESKTARENILPDRHYFNNSESNSKNVSNNHQGDVQLEYEPDTLTRINVHPTISFNNGYNESESFTESIDADGTKLNTSETEQHSENKGVRFSNRMDITRRYGSKGGYFRVGFDNSNNRNEDSRSNYTSRDIYDKDGKKINNEIQDQLIEQESEQDQYTLTADVRVPLTKKWNLDFNYRYSNTKDDNERLLYETEEDGDIYDVLNNDLSSHFKSNTYQHRPQTGIVYRGEKLTSGISGGLESVRLKNDESYTNSSFDNTYDNLFASFYVRYRINQMQSLNFRFNNSRSMPSINQLQPVTNTTDPLNIVTGNPDLKPGLNNRFSLNYNNFNYQTKNGYFIFMRGQFDDDQVVSKTVTDDDLVRTTTYTNVDGKYNFRVGARMFKQFEFQDKSTLRPQIGISATKAKDIKFSNDKKSRSNLNTFGPRFSVEYDIPDVVNIEPSYDLSYQNRKFSLSNQRDQSYTDHNVRLRLTSYWPEDFIIGSDITYTHNGQTGDGFDNDYVLWNMSVGYELWDGDGTAKIKVFDLLNQNVSSRRVTGEDYVMDTQQLVLKRYLMFSFTYKLNKFGGKEATSNQRRGGRTRGARMHRAG